MNLKPKMTPYLMKRTGHKKTTTKKNIGCDKAKKENRKQTKHAYEKQADSGLSAKNSDKPERSQKQHTACAGHIMKTMLGEEEAVPQHHQKLMKNPPIHLTKNPS